jgi:hypothetical protein
MYEAVFNYMYGLLLEQVLLVQLSALEGAVGVGDGDHTGDAVVGGHPVQSVAFGGLDLQFVRREVRLDPGVEDVVRHAPLVVRAGLVLNSILRPLELVTTADHDCLQVLPATLVDGGVVLDDCREQLSTTQHLRCIGVVALAVRVPGSGDVDQDLAQRLELAFGDLRGDLSLIDAGGQRRQRLVVQLRHALFLALALVPESEDAVDHDQRDQQYHHCDGDTYRHLDVLFDPIH